MKSTKNLIWKCIFSLHIKITIEIKFISGFRFEERTSTGCVNGNKQPIAGYRRDDLSLEKCVTECKKYLWCRGIGVSSNVKSHCRLLTNESSPLDGWTFIDSGKWAEPKDWKEGFSEYPKLQCLEKVEIRKFSFI